MKNFQAGQYIRQGSYKSFQPELINRTWLVDDMEVLQLLSEADRELGRLDMYSGYIPNLDLFIRMHEVKEATQSSRIEGTQTNMDEALMLREDISPERRDDWEEVQNYVLAMRTALGLLDKLPFSSRLIRETHKVLLQGVRGAHKLPGEFRRSQNWIGGATIKDAAFVPPIHESIGELMGDLEHFAHNESIYIPDLLRIALIHYQFETIHPFLDGNGRVGRLMITLYLVDKGILKQPVLYLSDFLEKNRQHYYEHLMRVRQSSDITPWFKFFLIGVAETARNGIKTFDAILSLQKETDRKLETLGRKMASARRLITALFEQPIMSPEQAAKAADISSPSAYNLIKDLECLEILKEITGAQRHRVYSFEPYLNIFKEQ